ncbi:hypothetical protein ACQEUU_25140 [Nonomuraea sp. CA-218870]|uniref:hypothetical protein n=1 Tax=Nonomuraea sp. CA-218870 TaxID=3239998 RepID=UPI003D917010
MIDKQASGQIAAARADERCTVILCKGCCCGNARKHPDVSQKDQMARLRLIKEITVRTSDDCLGVCSYSNVVVVRPCPAARRRGARPTWLGFVLDDTAVDAIGAWASQGGPGTVPPPDLLALHEIQPPRRPHPAAERRA